MADGPDRPATRPLSAREIEVARYLSYDLTTEMVADQLSISQHTVKSHVKSIIAKTGAKSRLGALCKLIRQGVI